MKIQKTAIFYFTVIILFYTLLSPDFLPNVVLPLNDTLSIVIFVAISGLTFSYISDFEAQKLEQKIILQHSQMESILNNSPTIMFLKDLKGHILMGNDRLAELLNIAPIKLVGLDVYNYFVIPETSRIEDTTAIETKEPTKFERIVSFTSGHSGYYRGIKAPVLDSRGKVFSIVVIMQNIDSELENEERKNTFVATIAHDLKTPTLAQIRALDLLLENTFGILNEEQKEIITQTKNSCKYMSNLIFTILDTYLFDNGQIKINYKPFKIQELVTETVSEISNLLIKKEQKLIVNSNLENLFIEADRFQIKRVLINFLANAISHGNRNSQIEVDITLENSDLHLSVKNKSKYLPKEDLSQLYQKFKTKSVSKSTKHGMGLGLYLSKQIIDAHKGHVFAESTPDGTCTFGFTLPKAPKVKNKDARILL